MRKVSKRVETSAAAIISVQRRVISGDTYAFFCGLVKKRINKNFDNESFSFCFASLRSTKRRRSPRLEIVFALHTRSSPTSSGTSKIFSISMTTTLRRKESVVEKVCLQCRGQAIVTFDRSRRNNAPLIVLEKGNRLSRRTIERGSQADFYVLRVTFYVPHAPRRFVMPLKCRRAASRTAT